MKQQEIRHPVGMVIPVSATRGGTWNDPPAQRTDGANFGTQFTPEGAIFRLPANLDLNAYSATFWDGVSVKRLFRLIAEAMQNYGCVIYDQGGNAIMVAEKGDTPQYASDPYYKDPIVSQVVGPPTVGGGFANTYILLSDPTVFPWDQMQLLKMNLVSS